MKRGSGSRGALDFPHDPGKPEIILGLFLSLFLVRETREYALAEARGRGGPLRGAAASVPAENRSSGVDGAPEAERPSLAEVLLVTSWKDRTLFSCSQAGMVNNLNDGMAWGLFPLFFAAADLGMEGIAWLVAVYPGVWGVAQLFTGPLSDRWGRKPLIVAGMWVQAVAIWLVAASRSFGPWLAGAILLGLGTALVYPTLLAAVGDVAAPLWRASAVGVYRLWRDGGYALGALLAGILADAFGLPWAIAAIGGLTFLSGLAVAGVMKETRPRPSRSL